MQIVSPDVPGRFRVVNVNYAEVQRQILQKPIAEVAFKAEAKVVKVHFRIEFKFFIERQRLGNPP